MLAGIAIGLALALAVFYFTGDKLFEQLTGTDSEAATLSVVTEASGEELTAYAFQIAGYIRDGDYKKLADAVHPEYGVVFSPYATISLTSNKCFTAGQVQAFPEDSTKYVWGKYDGKGDPIELTASDYFKTFVFDKDYTAASVIGVDTIIKSGNSLENIKDIFPKVRFVDLYMPGDADLEELDWSILRLGFEDYQGQLKLTLILHSQWTI